MLPVLFMEINAPEPSEVRPIAVTPPAGVTIKPSPLSSASAVPPFRLTDLEASNPVSKKICCPALTVMVASFPAQVTPFAPILPPATTAPKISTSCAPSMFI